MNIFVSGKARLFWSLFLFVVFSVCVQAEDTFDYDQIASGSYWRSLYPAGGWSLYCGYKFGVDQKTAAGVLIGIEHIYPMARMTNHAGCQNRMQCRESKNPKFIRMEADLHNMYPVSQAVITQRYTLRFGLVVGEDWRFDNCDLEWAKGVLEPRKIARGNIARAMLYMHARYDIPVDKKSLALFKEWNKVDPPSRQEQVRNNIIERLQGSRNPYIDEPSLAEQQKLTMLK